MVCVDIFTQFSGQTVAVTAVCGRVYSWLCYVLVVFIVVCR